MPLQQAQKRSLPDDVFEQLVEEIVSGRYAPGAAIPSERELSSILAVNRHVVREAIQRLEQIGLVKVAQGGRTKVLDYRHTAGLDLLALVAERAQPDEELLPLLKATLEMRAGIGVDLVALCAQRGAADVGSDLEELSEQLAQATGEDLLELDQCFWQRVLDGAGNLAYQLAFNSLIRAVHARRDLSIPWLERELAGSDYRRPIAAAIAAGDARAAAAAARDALGPPEGEELLAFGPRPEVTP
jgi:GntR family transcriptional regulator, transcriptional repressor for pyruvate dehydrogenase complex